MPSEITNDILHAVAVSRIRVVGLEALGKDSTPPVPVACRLSAYFWKYVFLNAYSYSCDLYLTNLSAPYSDPVTFKINVCMHSFVAWKKAIYLNCYCLYFYPVSSEITWSSSDASSCPTSRPLTTSRWVLSRWPEDCGTSGKTSSETSSKSSAGGHAQASGMNHQHYISRQVMTW